MKRRHLPTLWALPMLLCGLALPASADTVQARCDVYPKGSDKATASLACSFSQRQGFVRIQRADGVIHDLSPAAGGPGAFKDKRGQAAYRQSGLGSRGQIYRLAQESVFVYWDAAGLVAAAPTQAAPAEPAAPTRLPPVKPAAVPYASTLSLQGILMRLTSANAGSTNELRIVPSGLARDNTPVTRRIDGQVTGAEIADLDGDGAPEVYVYITSAGSGSYGSLLAFNTNKRRSLSDIVLPALSDTPGADKGYLGHDQFAVVESTLVRRFPVYREGDTNAAPSGGVRQIQYKLKPGEATWRLVMDRVVEY